MIHIANNVYLDADQYCFVVMEKQVKKEGKNVGEEYFTNHSYHGSHQFVVEKIMDLALKHAVNNDILGCVELIEGCKKQFHNILKLKRK